MTDSTHADTPAAPLTNATDERDAIREALPRDVHVLTYHGSEPHVALVARDSAPSTEYPSDGETIVLVEWHGYEDYALSIAEGGRVGWELTDELVSTHGTRGEAIDAAADAFTEA